MFDLVCEISSLLYKYIGASKANLHFDEHVQDMKPEALKSSCPDDDCPLGVDREAVAPPQMIVLLYPVQEVILDSEGTLVV